MRKDFRRVELTGGTDYSDHYYDDDAGMIDPDEVLQPHWQTADALLTAWRRSRGYWLSPP